MINHLSKILSVFIIVVVILSTTITVFADYPIFYQRYTADPSGLEANGRLYLYCSHDVYDPNRPGYIMNDITCISTDDLKNWTDHGEVFKASGWAGLAWAPVVVARNNKYYMYSGNGAGGIGVAVSDSPSGPFKDALGKALITASTPGVNPSNGFWLFDPGAFVDDNGQAYLYFGGNGEGNTRVIKLGSDMISINGSASQIVAPIFFEDSWIHKYNGKYYYSYSTNFSKGAATIDYMMSDNPMTGFQYKGTVLANPPSNEGNNNHHAIFSFKGNWYIAYHNRAVAIANGASAGDARTYQRSVCLDRLYYNADGTMQKVNITTNGLTQLKYVNPYITNEAETMAQESGIQTEACNEGGRDVCNIENGDWIKVRGVDFGPGAASFDARVASANSGGNIELRLDSPTGTLVGTCAISSTGGWQTWATQSCKASGVTGTHDLYLKFTGGSGYLFNLNWWKFNSDSSTPTPTPTSTLTPTPTPTPTLTPTLTPVPTQNPGAEFKVVTNFSLSTLVPNQMLTAKVTATNISAVPYSGKTDVLVIVGLYDSNNTMVNVSYISKGIAYQGTETLSAGFKLPSNTTGYVARAFMWDGTDIKTSNMIPMSNVVQIPNTNPVVTPTVKATPTPTVKVTPTPTTAAKFHCFLLLGQSNMAGYAKAQPSDKVEDPRVLVLGYDNNPALGRVTDQWDVACPPLHPAWLDAIGPGDWFGKTMIQKVPAGDTIGLIPCAISGEKIETFMKVGGSKYNWIINRAKLAQQKGGVIEGILFHQGESNNGDPSWPGKVKTLVEDLRKDLNLGNVPFLAGELLYSGPCAGHNTLVNQLPSLITNCYVVSANGLVVDPGDTTYRLHFSHDSSVTLGKRYAEKMIQALGW